MGVVIRQDGWAYQIDFDKLSPLWLPEADLKKIPLTAKELEGDDEDV